MTMALCFIPAAVYDWMAGSQVILRLNGLVLLFLHTPYFYISLYLFRIRYAPLRPCIHKPQHQRQIRLRQVDISYFPEVSHLHLTRLPIFSLIYHTNEQQDNNKHHKYSHKYRKKSSNNSAVISSTFIEADSYFVGKEIIGCEELIKHG